MSETVSIEMPPKPAPIETTPLNFLPVIEQAPSMPPIPDSDKAGLMRQQLPVLESTQAHEANSERGTLIKGIRNELQTIQRLLKGKIDWQFHEMPSENQRIAAANREFPQSVIEKVFPKTDFNNINALSDTDILNGQYQRNERLMRVYEGLGKSLNADQLVEFARISGEQELLKGYLGNPETIDVTQVDADFAEGGTLSTPEQQAKMLAYTAQFKSQRESLQKQNETYDGKVVTSFSVGGHKVDVTNDDLKSWGSNMAMVAGLSMLLLYMEGDKEDQQQGRRAGH